MYAARKILTDREFEDVIDDLYGADTIVCGMEYITSRLLRDCDYDRFTEMKNDYEDQNSPWVCEICNAEYDDQEHADNCCKVDMLCDMLEQLGYEGLDVNLKISLLEYRLVYNESTSHCVLCRNDKALDEVSDDDSILFDTCYISKSDITEALDTMDNGFYDYVGSTRDEYKAQCSLVRALYDIINYNDLLTPDLEYSMTINDVIHIIESIETSKLAAKTENERE